ncbi:hypothetical protein [Tolypothrix sp. VBCCA 56010]|uniref:hypothetical protein n=1 Tax=Tolypothrix sp. VBCCA 56010 TaxID=3137731 RepID=UPI003D7EA195
MVKILTGEELNELFLESLQTGTATLYKDDRQILYKGNNRLASNIYDRTIKLRNGLHVRILSFETTDELTAILPESEPFDELLSLSFFVTGDMMPIQSPKHLKVPKSLI